MKWAFFAELNGSYLKFVEDVTRLLYEQLINDLRINDFRVICSHQESLHSHDAVSVVLGFQTVTSVLMFLMKFGPV